MADDNIADRIAEGSEDVLEGIEKQHGLVQVAALPVSLTSAAIGCGAAMFGGESKDD